MVSVGLVERRAELLRRQIANCTDCHLYLYCRAPVPPTIPRHLITPELLIIGEAPGGQEDLKGEPFIGPAGGLFFRLLKIEVGLSRAQCMIGNSVQCRPTVAENGKMNRAPSKQEMSSCRDNVAKIIDYYAERGGRWVLLLGATVLQSIIPDARISSWAGRPFVVKHRRGLLNVFATYHPAAALRDPNHVDTIRRHLNYLAALRKDRSLWPEQCCLCRSDVARYDAMGVAWCKHHLAFQKGAVWAPLRRPRQGRLVV